MRGEPHNGCGPARTRGVAPEVSAQRACERSNERGRGAAGSPDTHYLTGRLLLESGSACFAVSDSASFVGGSACLADADDDLALRLPAGDAREGLGGLIQAVYVIELQA